MLRLLASMVIARNFLSMRSAGITVFSADIVDSILEIPSFFAVECSLSVNDKNIFRLHCSGDSSGIHKFLNTVSHPPGLQPRGREYHKF